MSFYYIQSGYFLRTFCRGSNSKLEQLFAEKSLRKKQTRRPHPVDCTRKPWIALETEDHGLTTVDSLAHIPDGPSIFNETEQSTLKESISITKKEKGSPTDPNLPFWKKAKHVRKPWSIQGPSEPKEDVPTRKSVKAGEDDLKPDKIVEKHDEQIFNPSNCDEMEKSSTQSQDSDGFRTGAENIISRIKADAQRFQNTGVDPSYASAVKISLQYYPGIEKQQRLREMLDCSETLDSLVATPGGTIENVNSLIRAQGERGEMKECLDTIERMENFGLTPDVDTFVNGITAAAKCKDANLARVLYLKMRSRLICPNVKVYTALMKAHIACNDIPAAFALLRKCEDEGITPDCVMYTALIDGLVKARKFTKAWDLFNQVRTWKAITPDAVLFTVMIKICGHTEEAEKAVNLLDDMRLCGAQPTDITYTELIHCFSKRGDYFDQCFSNYNQMLAEDMPITSIVYEYLFSACAKVGNVKKAHRVMKHLQKFTNFELSEAMYSNLICTFAVASQLPKATQSEKLANLRHGWQVIKMMREKKIKIGVRTLNAVIELYRGCGFYQYAVDMLLQFSKFCAAPNDATYEILFAMLANDAKDVQKFFAVWRAVTQIGPEGSATQISVAKPFVPSEKLLHLALEMAIRSKSSSVTLEVLRDMYSRTIFPTPKLAKKLSIAGSKILEINKAVNQLIKLQKETEYKAALKETELVNLQIDEHNLRRANSGLSENSETCEEQVRRKFFEKKKMKNKKSLPRHIYKQLKARGGPYYALHHDRPKPIVF